MRLKEAILVAGAAATVASVTGCGSKAEMPARPVQVAEAPDPWILSTSSSVDKTPALLWNGLCGFRFDREGGVAGQPFFSIEEYDLGGEEKIRALPSPAPNGFIVDGKPLSVGDGYRQTLDMRTSELRTEWKSGTGSVICQTVLHPTKRILSEKWTLSGLGQGHTIDFDLGINGKLGKESMLRTDFKFGPSQTNGQILATQNAGDTTTVEVTLTFSESSNEALLLSARGSTPPPILTQLRPPSVETFAQVEQEAKDEWTKRWKTDIEIDGPVADQQAVRSFLFYLQSAISPEGKMSLSPFGLSNQMYNGHVFWDADIWDFPALAFLSPNAAKAITDYRLATLAAAERNAIEAHLSGAKYPWESSVSGKETVIGPSAKEIHITGDVAWALHQAAALGFTSAAKANEVKALAGKQYKSAAQTQSGELWLKDVMSPDENHTGDNDLYTNLLAQWCTGPTTPFFRIPKDATGYLSYDGDPMRGYKQAAAVLSIYPLQDPGAEKQAKTMMDRFAGKVIKNGPAMSDSVHGLIWARIGESERAYKAWKDSWEPFTRQPLMLFSEKRTKATTYFATGAAGSLQTVLFGFLGFRLDSKQEPSAAWSRRLLGDNWLSIRPNLPKEWKSVKLKNFTVLGHRFTLTATHRPNGPDAAEVFQGD